MTTRRPTIGILLDYQHEGSFSARPHYALRCAYFDAVWKAGGLPVALPYLDDEAAQAYLEHCDGVITPGGFYPFPARLYGREADDSEIVHPRFRFEETLTRAAIDADKPLLGICAGMQVMAAVMGATVYADVHAELPTEFDHLNARPAEETAHDVEVEQGSHLGEVIGTSRLAVNTAHKEALRGGADGLKVTARAPDGVIEAVEVEGKSFCLGVQWHPEFFLTDGDPNFRLFQALVAAAREAA